MMILKQNKVRLDNYLTTRNNSYSSLGIYLTAAKVAQCRRLADNRTEKEKKKGNIKEDSHPEVMYPQKRSESFQKF